jgi:hypothetical protein
MLHDQKDNPHGSELDRIKDKSFLGKELKDEIAHGIAMGDLDPITFEPFPSNSEEEEKIINRVAKRKNKPASSFKSLILGGSKDSRPQEELPKFLKNNPHPHYLNLWN